MKARWTAATGEVVQIETDEAAPEETVNGEDAEEDHMSE